MLNDDLELVQQTLRFEAGVAPDRPDGSNDFLAALSAAMHERCRDEW